MSKKILYFVTEDRSLLSHRLPLAKAARAAGYEVVVACRVRYDKAQLEKAGLRVIPLKQLKRGGTNPFQELAALREIIKVYKSERPDIVHQVTMKPVLYGSMAARIARVPRVVNALGGLGFLYMSQSFKARALRTLISPFVKFLLNRKGTKLILQNPDDQSTLGRLVRPETVELIRGAGVDITHFSQTPEPKTSPIRVAVVSRMLKDKGIGEVVEASRLLKGRGVDIQFCLYGDPDPENPTSCTEAELQAWVSEGLITYHGPIDDAKEAYKDCHIATLPSYREGMPKSLLEAAAMGRPIVTTDVPGCRDVVQDGVNGFLVPAKNAEALAAALEKLVSDAGLRKMFGAQGRKLCETNFAEEIILKQTLALYQ